MGRKPGGWWHTGESLVHDTGRSQRWSGSAMSGRTSSGLEEGQDGRASQVRGEVEAGIPGVPEQLADRWRGRNGLCKGNQQRF